ncbi:MAG: hypothetical protein COA78_05335 [Blastopirellula sp.]|nr:MAG: hypothetical protein COA78_05335 [Blastopirellula sp.]
MNDIKSKSEQYRKIRKAVFNEATISSNPDVHEANKLLLKDNITRVCRESNIDNYLGDSKEIRNKIWHLLWTRIRYSGIKAATASKEIQDITSIFDQYSDFTKSEWDIEIEYDKSAKKMVLKHGGNCIHHFLNRTGQFSDKQTVGNLVKLNKTVLLARAYNAHLLKSESPLDFVTSGANFDDVWKIHSHLQAIGYTADITALHFMMDLGLSVIKPDIVITRLFLNLGWLHDIIPELPHDLTAKDLVGKGAYRSKYDYMKPKIYKPVIDLSRKIVAATNSQELKSDLGWVTGNPGREFDIFMVKFGQEPESHWGITKNLAKEPGEVRSNVGKRPL